MSNQRWLLLFVGDIKNGSLQPFVVEATHVKDTFKTHTYVHTRYSSMVGMQYDRVYELWHYMASPRHGLLFAKQAAMACFKLNSKDATLEIAVGTLFLLYSTILCC